jgi:hypothetical protein
MIFAVGYTLDVYPVTLDQLVALAEWPNQDGIHRIRLNAGERLPLPPLEETNLSVTVVNRLGRRSPATTIVVVDLQPDPEVGPILPFGKPLPSP